MSERQKIFNELSRAAHSEQVAVMDVTLDEITALRAQVAALTEQRGVEMAISNERGQKIEQLFAELSALTAALGKAREALACVKDRAMTSYGKNDENYIEDDEGELCYIVPYEPMLGIDEALAAIDEAMGEKGGA